MKAFIAILLTILVIGLAIVQLILIRWTDGWLWPILHAALVIVSDGKNPSMTQSIRRFSNFELNISFLLCHT